jgi:hypothetical protein
VTGLLLASLCVFTAALSFAQETEPVETAVRIEVAAEPIDPTAPPAAAGSEMKPKKDVQRGEFVFAPIPTSSPALGSGVVPVFGYIFQLSKRDTISPPSLVGVVGLITNNGSRAFAVGGQLYLKQNTYQITAAFAHGNLNYNLYGTGILAGNAGVKLPIRQAGQAFFGEVVRRLGWKFFLGPRFFTGHSLITLNGSRRSSADLPPDVGLQTRLTSMGIRLVRDTRPNRFYPTSGTLFNFTSDFFSQALGSKYSFQSYKTAFNKYGRLSTNQVLAYNAFFCATGGQPPFYGNCIYGMNNELRGYEAGRYLDRYMFATQLEYRLLLPKRFGLVGFGGIGGVAPGGRALLRTNSVLPSVGGGLRFMLSKKNHVNLRADFAQGKEGHTFSMGVGEAF